MTTASTAKARILTLLGAASALDGVLLRYGQATKQAQVPGHPDVIYLGQITQGGEEQGALGRLESYETYSIAFTVATFLAGDDEVATETRCCAILTAMLDAFKVDGQAPILGVSGGPGLLRMGMTWSDVTVTTDPVANPNGWQSAATGLFNCVANVQPTP